MDFAPIVLDFDKSDGTDTVIGSDAKSEMTETTWRLIVEAR